MRHCGGGGVVGVVTQFCYLGDVLDIVRVELRGQLEAQWLRHGEVEGDLWAVVE